MDILIPHSRLTQYLRTDAKPIDITRCLSLCGPTIDALEKIPGDYIYHAEIITNRVDAASAYGLAREAAAILPEFGFSAQLIDPPITDIQKLLSTTKLNPLDMKIVNDPQLNPRIVAIKIDHVLVSSSPPWLTTALSKYGQRSLNNLIDITNFVMFELGHPVHVFDFDRLTNKKIIVREAKQEESLITLDQKIIKLNGGEIVYDDGSGQIVDFPGIMGTANSVVTNNTKTALLWIEANHSQKIRQASLAHQLRSHAAILNEKNVDPEMAPISLMYSTQLALELANGQLGSQMLDLYPRPQKSPTVTLDHAWLEKFAGIAIPTSKVSAILTRLQLEPKTTPAGKYQCLIPSHRSHDLSIPEDIAEEVLRIYGYFRLPSKLPHSNLDHIPQNTELDLEYYSRQYLTHLGFTEIYNNSLISTSMASTYHLDLSQTFRLSNPLSQDYEIMRPCLVPSLIENLRHNPSSSYKTIQIFELANVYSKSTSNHLADEMAHLAFITRGGSFLTTKGYLTSLCYRLQCQITFHSLNSQSCPKYFNYRLSAAIYLGSKIIGILGNLNETNLYGCEVNFNALAKASNPIHHFKPISPFTPINEDLTYTLPPRTPIGPVIATIENFHQLINQVSLKTTFNQNHTFSLSYLSLDQQLAASDISPLRKALTQKLESLYHAKLVGKLA